MVQTVKLPQQLGFEQVSAWLKQTTTQLGGSSDAVVLDAVSLQQFDSATLAAFIEIKKYLQRFQVSLNIVNAPSKLRGLARIYAVEQLLFE